MVQNGACALTPSDVQNGIDVVHQNHLLCVGYGLFENPVILQAFSGAYWTF